MQYRKPKMVQALLALVSSGFMMAGPVEAETVTDQGEGFFKGPASTCVTSSSLVYPCVSLSPPAYRPHPGTGIVDAVVMPYLLLDSGVQVSDGEDSWLVKLKNGAFWNPDWRLTRHMRSMNMDFTMKKSGAVVDMRLGVLKFNINVDDSGLSESRIFLGVDRSW